jgi:hypothetical protein
LSRAGDRPIFQPFAPDPGKPELPGAAVPRSREQILANLETLYRESFERAAREADEQEKRRLDFGFRRDQLYLEAILDVRDLLGAPAAAPEASTPEKGVLEQINDIRRATQRFPFGS